jgi:hypothetical protein
MPLLIVLANCLGGHAAFGYPSNLVDDGGRSFTIAGPPSSVDAIEALGPDVIFLSGIQKEVKGRFGGK